MHELAQATDLLMTLRYFGLEFELVIFFT